MFVTKGSREAKKSTVDLPYFGTFNVDRGSPSDIMTFGTNSAHGLECRQSMSEGEEEEYNMKGRARSKHFLIC